MMATTKLNNIKFWRGWAVFCYILLVSPINAIIYQNYQYHQYRHRHQPKRETSYLLQTQKYRAVPGSIVHQYREYPQYQVAPLLTPPLPRLTVPVVPLFPRFRIEADSESHSPQPEDSEEEMSQQQAQPQPGQEPEEPESQPPPEQPSESEQPPPNYPEENPTPPMYPPSDDPPKIIHKHVSIHIPPEEMEQEEEVTIIRPKVPQQPDKQVNIIFIKAPTPPKKKFEVILPKAPEEKTLIYVLVKKPTAQDSIDVRGPPPTLPPKPKVFFIKYKNNKDENSPPSYHIFTAKKQDSYRH